jgi:Helix-turn-helix domain
MDKKIGHTSKDTAPKKSRFNNNSAHAQRQKLLVALKELDSVTTVYARDVLGIMAPAPRALELRAMGYKIVTERVNETDSLGLLHHGVARYVLLAEANGGVQ